MKRTKFVKLNFTKASDAKKFSVDRSAETLTKQTHVQQTTQKSSGGHQPDHKVTRLLIKMRAENEKISARLRAQKLAHSNLINKLKSERTAHQQTKTKLDRSESRLNQLRKLSAVVQIKAERLAKEKADIKRQSDATIKETQASLDAIWLKSIFCARQAASTQN